MSGACTVCGNELPKHKPGCIDDHGPCPDCGWALPRHYPDCARVIGVQPTNRFQQQQRKVTA